MKPRQPSGRADAARKRWQFHQAPRERPGRCGEGPRPVVAPAAEPRRREDNREMPAEALKCKECSTTYPLEARYVCERCFGPLEVAYAPPALRSGRAEAPHPGGPALALALRRLPAARARAARVAADGLDAARARRPPRRAARRGRDLDQERDGEPDALVQGPRRLRRARPRDRARLRHRRVRLDRQPRRRRGRARRLRRAARVRLHPRRPRAGEDPLRRRLRRADHRRPRQLRRRQPPLHRGLRRARELGVRQRQRAAVLRRGLQDARLRDGRAARLGAARPRRRADRLGLAVHEGRARLPGVHRRRAAVRRGARDARRAGRGLLAGRAGLTPPARTCAARSSPTRSPSRSRSATRPTARTPSTSRGAPAAASRRSPTTRSAPASACWPRRRASSPRPPAA